MRTIILMLLLTVPAFSQTLDPFWQIYEKETIAEKKEIWRELSAEARTHVRRMNFAWGVGHLQLSGAKVAYLARFSAALPGISDEDRDHFQREAEALFTVNEGSLLFGSIGPYVPCNVFVKESRLAFLLPNCPCSIGSKFNMSCSGSCTTSSSCTTTTDGCGFAWLYACTGWCVQE